MSHIDDLIKRYAPSGVEYKTLDEALPTRLGGYWGVEAGVADVSAYAIRNGDVGGTGQLRWGALPLRGFPTGQDELRPVVHSKSTSVGREPGVHQHEFVFDRGARRWSYEQPRTSLGGPDLEEVVHLGAEA